MAGRTLDVVEPQVLLHFPDDQGLQWHHRVLLHKLQPGVWVCVGPDHEIETHDLNQLQYRVLPRAGAFPNDILHEIYAFDPITGATLARFKQLARTQAAILGEVAAPDAEVEVWVVSEVGHARFGQEIPSEVVDDPARFTALQHKAVADWEDELLHAERVDRSQVAKYIEERKKADQDHR
eukprot:8126683-Alexandrium_andersonii.AAC.1